MQATFMMFFSITVTTLAQEFLTKNGNTSDNRAQKNLDLCISKFCTKTVLSIVVKEGKKFIDFISSKRFTFVTYINDNKYFDENKERFEQIFDEIKKYRALKVFL
uniref:Uncharacterized protein n=3 Tax=Strongyloides stercoralis TaxID=6248 RepID=A0AAF5DHR8_STRER